MWVRVPVHEGQLHGGEEASLNINFKVTNASDYRRCAECGEQVRWTWDALDEHAREHGGEVGRVDTGIRV